MNVYAKLPPKGPHLEGCPLSVIIPMALMISTFHLSPRPTGALCFEWYANDEQDDFVSVLDRGGGATVGPEELKQFEDWTEQFGQEG